MSCKSSNVFRSPVLLLGILLLSVIFMPIIVFRVEAAAGSLSGESLFNPDPGKFSITGGCNIDGSGTFTYEVAGTAVGPYAGTFHEKGTFTISSGGQVVVFNATFTIFSGSNIISGSKALVSAVGRCLNPDYAEMNGIVSYSATINKLPDSGVSKIQLRGGSTAGVFFEDFVGTGSTPLLVTLDPVAATNEIGTKHTVTATVLDSAGKPASGVNVFFTVTGSVEASPKCVTDTRGQCSVSYTGPQLPGADMITGCADSNRNGNPDPDEPCGAATKAWIAPASTPGQVTGGGQIMHTLSMNGVTFGFNAHSTGNGLNGQGVVIDQSSATKIKLLDVTALVVSPTQTHATFFGNATINGMNTTYRIDVDDLAEPGLLVDTFKIITDSGYTAGGPLTQGNIQIHR